MGGVINLGALDNTAFLFTLAAILATAVTLTLAVNRSLSNPTKRQSFDEALSYVMSSELDIDTALNKSETKKRGWFDYWADQVEHSGTVLNDRSAPGRLVLTIALGGGAFGAVVFPGGVLGLLVMPLVAIFIYRTWLGAEARKRVFAMEKQLPQLLSGLRANLQAGSTPQQAMLAVADDLPAPLGDEVRLLKRDLNVNVALEMALSDLARRVPSREMQFLVASVEIAVRSGADLDPQLATIQEIVAQRTRIRQKLRAAVAQVKPTKILAYGAVPLMFFVSIRTPENREYWFGNGIFILIIAAILYGAGGALIRMMVRSVENS